MSHDFTNKKSASVRVMAFLPSANVDPDLCRHMVSLGHSEIYIYCNSNEQYGLAYVNFSLISTVEAILCWRQSSVLNVWLRTANLALFEIFLHDLTKTVKKKRHSEGNRTFGRLT